MRNQVLDLGRRQDSAVLDPQVDSPKQNSLHIYEAVERLRLAGSPTAIENCERLRKAIPGAPSIYIKRDDYLGYLIGGNKLRKLEYIMADVLRKKATTVVTVGSIQSNHARVTAMVAKRLGLKCVLVLNGEVPSTPRGNYYIVNQLKATVLPVETREERVVVMDQVSEDLRKKGERVYRIPLGSSDEIGSFGFVAALEEMVNQSWAEGLNFEAIFLASSSGGTQAGLEVGKRLFGLKDLQVVGVSADDSSESIKGYMIRAMEPMLKRLEIRGGISSDELCVDDRQIGGGYGVPSESSCEAQQLFRDCEGILLDPVYTSKSAAALIASCRARRFDPESNVLFWHTGGVMAHFQ
jgi:D-cysteine desulfhydrase family pyridoxal phosphate-dependent enzyme